MPEQQNQTEPESSFRAAQLFFWDFLKVFLMAVAIIIPIRFFLFQPFVVTGDSMRPNFEDGDYLIIDEITYRFRQPERGEVMVLRSREDPTQFFIKRTVGLPGERIVITGGQITVFNPAHAQGLVLQESYLPDYIQTYGNTDVKLQHDEYFVLGDNRLSSSDSRLWGALQKKNIVGRVILRALPIREFKIFAKPAYLFAS